MILRHYQDDLFTQVISSNENLLVQLDTGAGKTPIIGKLAGHYSHAVVVCHRNILIKQASEKLAMCGVEHAIIAGNQIKKISANNNFNKAGRHFINPKSTVILVSIDTYNSKLKLGKEILDDSQEWVILLDEAHHFAEDNKWEAIQQHLKCPMVGFTATPIRGDGQPMTKAFGGFFDRITQAKGYENNSTEKLISEGFLSEYTAFYCERRETYCNGTVSNKKHAEGAECLHTRKQLALGKSALDLILDKCKNRKVLAVFPRIDIAEKFIMEAKKAGHNAQTIHSKLPQYQIQRILEAYEQGDIQTLASVDMVNEGFDIPSIDSLVLCRDISSFGFYRQICGRGLRPEGLPLEIWDLAGTNILRHGLPSDPINWNEQQAKQVRKDLMICPYCSAFTKRSKDKCSSCNKVLKKPSKSGKDMSVLEYTSYIKKTHRQQISNIDKEKAILERKAKADYAHKNSFIDQISSFPSTLVGKRCRYFFDTLKEELKYLDCKTYNDFFIKNLDSFRDMSFYIGTFNANFDKNKLTQCKKLYEKHK